MRNLILNIGMDGRRWPVELALQALDLLPAIGKIETGLLLLDTEAEPVFVVYMETDLECPPAAIAQMASELGQDAIAVWDATEARGYLAGPRRATWEPFDPEKFITLERYAAAFHPAP